LIACVEDLILLDADELKRRGVVLLEPSHLAPASERARPLSLHLNVLMDVAKCRVPITGVEAFIDPSNDLHVLL
jgi:hypothetical protein